jgi:uncharacterized protein (DUF2147 family)
MFRGLFLLWLATLALATLPPGAAQAGDPAGLWQSESGLSRYQVRHCGPGICVKIVWIVEGPEVRDAQNPTPALRGRRVMGIDIASNFAPTGPNIWTGRLYNFKNGNLYSGRAELVSAHELHVKGCVLSDLFCITQRMQRLN